MAIILIALLIFPLIAVVFDLVVTRVDGRQHRPELPELRVSSPNVGEHSKVAV